MKFLAFEGELTEDQKKNTQTWVNALRSGEFKQAQSALCKGDSYCCLGVASEIQKIPKEGIAYCFPDGIISSISPSMDWFIKTYGWHYDSIYFEDEGMKNCIGLYEINDRLEWTFDQIADLIETVYLKRQDFNA